ncbi:MAG: gliding motility-associated C-terminal domain-containing protein, partial [Candidatus Latescibacter sp.]|nr:gliding motility-associated C-terminal domain-containing protein [Candidatus Latescibacter sp.]
RRYDGENLALFHPSGDYRLTDGDLSVGYPYSGSPVGGYQQVDLLDNFLINKIVVYTGGSNPQNWVTDSPRGFYARSSSTILEIIHEVGISNADNGGYNFAEVSFPPAWVRYPQYYIFEARVKPPNIGEIMVYGSGYLYSATYESPWISLGDPMKLKTIDKVTWEGDVPRGTGVDIYRYTKITVQTQTRSRLPDGTPSAPSVWSIGHTAKRFDFDSPEPVNEFKYKVFLETNHISMTPTFNAISVNYTTEQPIADGKASITPAEVKMGELTNFVYTVDYSLNTGQNLKTISILVPNYATVDSVYSSEANKLVPFTADTSLGTMITVSLANPVTNADGKSPDFLKIYFKTTLLTNSFQFASVVSNDSKNDNTGALNLREDPVKHWVAYTKEILTGLVSDVQARPKAFTPNGDNKNDYTVIEFRLYKSSASIRVEIYDTAGNIVVRLYKGTLTPRDYIGDTDPGRWDGKGVDKKLVPPGIYIYQVIAYTSSGLEVHSGTVAMAY